MRQAPVPRWLRCLACAVPQEARAAWLSEWHAEWCHAASAGPPGRRLVMAAAEDALRLGARRVSRPSGIAGLLRDVRLAARTLRRQPGFAVSAILTIALGVGANTAVFSVLDAILLRPLPVSGADRVVAVMREKNGDTNFNSPPDYLDWQSRTRTMAALAALQSVGANLYTGTAPLRVSRVLARPEIFDVLGVQPAMGRPFGPDDVVPGRHRVVILSWELWQSAFGAASDILGRAVDIEAERFTVVGVMPPGVRLAPLAPDIWVPQVFDAGALQSRGRMNQFVFGRLRQDATLEEAQTEFRGIAAQLADAHPRTNAGWSARVEPLRDFAVGSSARVLWMLFAGVILVLAVACLNLTNLLTARLTSRAPELAIRVAIGASRGRLVSELLAESAVIGVAGGALGLGLAALAIDSVRAMLPAGLAAIGDVALDTRVLAFTLCASLVAGLASGAAAALRLTARDTLAPGVADRLRARGGTHRMRRGVAAAQFAAAALLLIASILVGRSLTKLYGEDLGLDYRGVSTFRVTFPGARFDSDARLRRAVDDMLAGLEGAGATAAAVSHLPLTGAALRSSLLVQDGPEETTVDGLRAAIKVVTPGYFETLRIPVIHGRSFAPADRAGAEPVAIVNETAARAYWPGRDPIGKWVSYVRAEDGTPLRRRVIGVVGDVRYAGPALPPESEVYEPHLQTVDVWGWFGRSMSFVVRTPPGRSLRADQVAAIARDVDPTMPVVAWATLGASLDRTLSEPRFNATLIGAFGTLAILLAALGMYAVLSFGVRMRARELGIRAALGESRSSLMRSVVREAVWIAGTGGAAGIAAALLLSTTLRAFVWGVTPTDPATFALAVGVLFAATLAGVAAPACRAAGADPLRALQAR